jgi:hypothetical protein
VIRIMIGVLAAVQFAMAQVPHVEPGIEPVVAVEMVPDAATSAIEFFGISMDGGDYLFMSDTEAAGAFDFGLNSFTIQVWIKFNSLAGLPFIFQSRDGTNDWGVYLRISGTQFEFALDDRNAPSGPGAGWAPVYATAPDPVLTDVWYHIVAVCDRVANESYIYINGVLQGTADITGLLTMTSGDTDFLLGSNVRTTSFLNGEISSFSVHKGAAVTDLNDRYTPYSVSNGRTAAWMFQPGSGTTATPYVGIPIWSFGVGAAGPQWDGPYTGISAGGPQ